MTTQVKTSYPTNLVDRLAGFVGAWAIKRLYDPQCKEYSIHCCDCQAKEILDTMEKIAYDR